jgi:integrase
MVSVGKTPAGRPICKPLKPDSYFQTYNDAYAALAEYNRNPYDLAPSITVKELYERWSGAHYKTLSSQSSVRVFKAAWKYCASVYGMRVLDIRGRHIKGCMEDGTVIVKGKEQRASAAVKNKIKSIFNLMLDYALEYEIVDRNYARSFTISNEVVKEMASARQGHIPFTDEEIALLWENVADKRCVDVILIQCYSGWRPQELGLIELENVDLENWTFKGGMKTDAGADRIVPIHSRVRPLVLQKYEEAKKLGSKYLLTFTDSIRNRSDIALTYHRYQKRFNLIRDELKLNALHRPHDGRVHFVTAAKKHSVDEYAIKYIIGHAISDITEKVYTKRELDWLRDEMEKIK